MIHGYLIFNRSVAYYYLGGYKSVAVDYEKVVSVLPRRMLWYHLELILIYEKLRENQRAMEITEKDTERH